MGNSRTSQRRKPDAFSSLSSSLLTATRPFTPISSPHAPRDLSNGPEHPKGFGHSIERMTIHRPEPEAIAENESEHAAPAEITNPSTFQLASDTETLAEQDQPMPTARGVASPATSSGSAIQRLSVSAGAHIPPPPPVNRQTGIKRSGWSLERMAITREHLSAIQRYATSASRTPEPLPQAEVLQQEKEGRVEPTLQARGIAINDDVGLEREADVMGARAATVQSAEGLPNQFVVQAKRIRSDSTNPYSQPSVRQNESDLTAYPIQRRAIWDAVNNRLTKSGRRDFDPALITAMPVVAGQHRAHTISYEIICRGVIDPINGGTPNYLDGLVKAVFPNGGTSTRHPALAGLALGFYNAALAAVNAIKLELVTVPRNNTNLTNQANNLISALNNSPDNLRPGSGTTNMSIGAALDLEQDHIGVLPTGTMVTDDPAKPLAPLTSPLTVIRVSTLNETQIQTLLAETWSNSNELTLYSSGRRVQSSDVVGMTSGSMSTATATPVAIPLIGGGFRLFVLS